MAIILFPVLFLHLVLIFLNESYRFKKLIFSAYAVSAAFFLTALALPGLFIPGVTPKLAFDHYPDAGLLHLAFIIFFFIVVCLGFYKLLKKFITTVDFRRNQARYIFIGWLFGIAGVASFFPLSFGIPIYPLGNYFVMVFAVVTSYAVARHHLMDIDIVINRVILFAYFTAFTLFLHTGLVYVLLKVTTYGYAVSSVLSGGIILAVMAFLARSEDRFEMSRRLNNIIYGARYKYRSVMEQLGKIAMVTFDFDGLVKYLIDVLVTNLDIEKISLLLIDKHRGYYEIRASSGLPAEVAKNFALPSDSELVTWLKRYSDTFSEDEANKTLSEEKFKVIAEDLKGLQTSRSIPLFYKKELLGILNLSEKKDKRPFTQEEMDIIYSFVKQMVVHIKNAILYEDSITDSLTRLYHHEYFYHRLKEEINRVKRYGHPLALLMIDIDHFKEYNDTYGHQAGDRALIEIATLLRSNVRTVDVVARYGGEEFCIIAPETDRKGAELFSERLRKTLQDQTKILQQKEELIRKSAKKASELKGISVSVGIAVFDKSQDDLDRHRFIKQADEALYKAKNKGGNRIMVI